MGTYIISSNHFQMVSHFFGMHLISNYTMQMASIVDSWSGTRTRGNMFVQPSHSFPFEFWPWQWYRASLRYHCKFLVNICGLKLKFVLVTTFEFWPPDCCLFAVLLFYMKRLNVGIAKGSCFHGNIFVYCCQHDRYWGL